MRTKKGGAIATTTALLLVGGGAFVAPSFAATTTEQPEFTVTCEAAPIDEGASRTTMAYKVTAKEGYEVASVVEKEFQKTITGTVDSEDVPDGAKTVRAKFTFGLKSASSVSTKEYNCTDDLVVNKSSDDNTSETPGTETPGTETPGTEAPGTEEPGTETPGTEEPGTDNSGTETATEMVPVPEPELINPWGDQPAIETTPRTIKQEVPTYPADTPDQVKELVKQDGRTEDGRYTVTFASSETLKYVYTVTFPGGGTTQWVRNPGDEPKSIYLEAGVYPVKVEKFKDDVAGEVLNTTLSLGQTETVPVTENKPRPTITATEGQDAAAIQSLEAHVKVERVTNDEGVVAYHATFSSYAAKDATYTLRTADGQVYSTKTLAAGADPVTIYVNPGSYTLEATIGNDTVTLTLNVGVVDTVVVTDSRAVIPKDAIVVHHENFVSAECTTGALSFRLPSVPNGDGTTSKYNVFRYGVGPVVDGKVAAGGHRVDAPATVDKPADDAWVVAHILEDVDATFNGKLYMANGTKGSAYPVATFYANCAPTEEPGTETPGTDTEQPGTDTEQPATETPAVDQPAEVAPVADATADPAATDQAPKGAKKLPLTGASTGLLAGLAALFGIAGAGSVAVARRR